MNDLQIVYSIGVVTCCQHILFTSRVQKPIKYRCHSQIAGDESARFNVHKTSWIMS